MRTKAIFAFGISNFLDYVLGVAIFSSILWVWNVVQTVNSYVESHVPLHLVRREKFNERTIDCISKECKVRKAAANVLTDVLIEAFFDTDHRLHKLLSKHGIQAGNWLGAHFRDNQGTS